MKDILYLLKASVLTKLISCEEWLTQVSLSKEDREKEDTIDMEEKRRHILWESTNRVVGSSDNKD